MAAIRAFKAGRELTEADIAAMSAPVWQRPKKRKY